MGCFKQSTVSEGTIGERQSEKRACLVSLSAQCSVSGVGVELPPVLRGGVVEHPAQRIVFRHTALDVLGTIRCLSVGLSASMKVYQLLLSPADPPVSDVAIPVRIVDRGSDIELVTHGWQEPRDFRMSALTQACAQVCPAVRCSWARNSLGPTPEGRRSAYRRTCRRCRSASVSRPGRPRRSNRPGPHCRLPPPARCQPRAPRPWLHQSLPPPR